MRSTVAPDPMPQARSRRTPIATLLAILALCAATQALAPAGAGAVISQSGGSLFCASIGGFWSAQHGACVIADGSGGWIVVGEVVNVKAPALTPPECDNLSCPLQQIGEQGSKRPSGEVAKTDPRGNRTAPVKSGPKAPKGKAGSAGKARCAGILRDWKKSNADFQKATKERNDLDNSENFDFKKAMEVAPRKAKAEKARAANAAKYQRGKCEPITGPLPE